MRSKSKGMIYIGWIVAILVGMVCIKQAFAAASETIIPTQVDLDSDQPWVVYGHENGDDLGWSVSAAGDVNGDGFGDVIVGAPLYGTDQEGTAFVYHGGEAGLDSTPDWTMGSGVQGVRFGNAVSGAGDINGDGWDDVIVGAPHFESDSNQTNEGIVYLYLGHPVEMSTTPNWTYECDLEEATCGNALGDAGDLNGDGYDDVVIGAPHLDVSLSAEGAVFIFLGSPTGLSNIPDELILGDQEDGELGSSVAGAGDVDGDGFDDVIVGAQHYPYEGELNIGAAFLYRGSDDGLIPTHDWESYGREAYSMYGASVHGAGDVDQDGYDDVIIGAYLFGTNGGLNQPDEGAAYLYKGSPTGLEITPDWTSTGSKAEARFGYSVGAAGDVNGDGGSDVVIGAPDYKFDSKTVVGSALVYYTQKADLEVQVFMPLLMVQDGE